MRAIAGAKYQVAMSACLDSFYDGISHESLDEFLRLRRAIRRAHRHADKRRARRLALKRRNRNR